MSALRNQSNSFPHVAIRMVSDEPEPYLPGTGLAVWEIAWLARAYEGDIRKLQEHLSACPIDRNMIEEALAYADAHAEVIDADIKSHTERPLEELLELLPGMRVVEFDPDEPIGHST